MGDRNHTKKNQTPRRWQYTCPVCKRRVTVPQDDPSKLPKYFPFCSQRCKLIDLGAWLDADYRIPSKPDDESEHPRGKDASTDEGNARK